MQYEIGQSSASSAFTSDSHEQWKVPGQPERASRYQSTPATATAAEQLRRGYYRRIATGRLSELRTGADTSPRSHHPRG